jgi:tRNA-2-methylthio-N6-dimethylallyladenosine synthase
MNSEDLIRKNTGYDGSLKYHIVTYGCQMNEHESEKIAGICEALGFIKTDDKAEADLIVLNTCCVRENAENKIIGNIGALKNLKAKNRKLKIAVLGCMTQQEQVAQKIYKTFPFVDIVLGTHNLNELSGLLQKAFSENKRTIDIWDSQGRIVEDETVAVGDSAISAYVNIMYGCNNFCSYCIVPYVRGRERSREPGKIIDEIKGLSEKGFREIMLLGQNVNSYGKELGVSFAQLLSRICGETPVERIRFMTSHPKDLSDELIGVMAANEQICKHIHLPVQSGSTRILDLMNRRYTREDYLLLTEKLRAAMPGIAITTDIIAGFPTETEEDFLKTLSLVEKVRFEAAFTFVYSKRSGTSAAEMEGQIPEDVKKDRIVRLVALQNGITEEVNKSYEGTLQRVLAEGLSTRSKRHVSGRAESGKTVNFAGDESMINHFYNIRITQGKKTTLFGEIEE